MPIAAIILAAGASTRLGRPKQTVEISGETLVVRAARTAEEAGLSPVIVVLPPEGDFGHSLQQRGCLIVVNEHAAEGIGSSIRRGVNLARLLQSTGAVLMTCDQIAVTADHLRMLCAQPETVTGSAYGGVTGVPAYFPAGSFAALLALQGDTGARKLLLDARSIPTEALAFDVDVEADVERARRFLEST